MRPIEELQRHNRGRDPERLALKLRKMRAGPFTFLRGSCHLLAARLSSVEVAAKGPVGWICGDLHLENFGSYAADNRQVYFDLNDFDEALLAPAAWDLLHLLTSLHVAATERHVAPETAQRLGEAMIDAYFAALARGKPMWVERETAQGPVRLLLDSLRERRRVDFLDRRTVVRGRRRRLRIDGEKALEVDDAGRARAERIVHAYAVEQGREDFFEVLDVARRIAGTGSLGLERYVVLVRGQGGADGHHLIDLKRAVEPSSARWLKQRQPRWRSEAHRTVALQQRMQAVGMAFLSPRVDGKRSYVLRALQPGEDRLLIDGRRLDDRALADALETLARCAAWAHLRAGGQQGAAIADEWIEWGQARRRRNALLAAARALARETLDDWQSFARAWDDGVFGPAGAGRADRPVRA